MKHSTGHSGLVTNHMDWGQVCLLITWASMSDSDSGCGSGLVTNHMMMTCSVRSGYESRDDDMVSQV